MTSHSVDLTARPRVWTQEHPARLVETVTAGGQTQYRVWSTDPADDLPGQIGDLPALQLGDSGSLEGTARYGCRPGDLAEARPQIEIGYWVPTRYSVTIDAADIADTLRQHGPSPSAVLAAETAARIASGDITSGEAHGDEDETKLGLLVYTIAGHSELFNLPDGTAQEPDETGTAEDFTITVIPALAAAAKEMRR
jgi:hypothetical protein